jgi:hypothetical protein
MLFGGDRCYLAETVTYNTWIVEWYFCVTAAALEKHWREIPLLELTSRRIRLTVELCHQRVVSLEQSRLSGTKQNKKKFGPPPLLFEGNWQIGDMLVSHSVLQITSVYNIFSDWLESWDETSDWDLAFVPIYRSESFWDRFATWTPTQYSYHSGMKGQAVVERAW